MTQPLFIVYYDLGLGGIQKKIIDIVNFLAIDRPNLKIYILLRRGSKFNLGKQIQNKKTEVIYYSNWLRWQILFFFPVFVIHHVWKLKPRAILAFSDVPAVASVWAKLLFFRRKIEVVISEDPNTLPSKQISTYRFAHLRHFLIVVFYPFAGVVFTINRLFFSDLIKTYHLSPKKVRLISNWTNLVEKKIGHRKKIYDLIFVGRLDLEKNVGFLIKGVERLKNHKKDIILCLVGEGEVKKKLQIEVERCHLEKNVFFIGPTMNVENYLSQAKIFVLPSKSEGLPLAVLEAMASGLPVLSSNYPGVREVIRDSVNGFIFNNQTEFIRRTKWLLKNPRQRRKIGRQARQYVKQYHSPENIDQYLEALGLKNTKNCYEEKN